MISKRLFSAGLSAAIAAASLTLGGTCAIRAV